MNSIGWAFHQFLLQPLLLGKAKDQRKKSKRPLAKGKTLASTPSCSKNGDQDSAQNESESRDSPFILGSDEESSSYYTDEELGGDTGGKQKKKRRRVREVSSCSSEEDELMEEGRIKRRRKSGRAIDDGDEEMYKMRIYKDEEISMCEKRRLK